MRFAIRLIHTAAPTACLALLGVGCTPSDQARERQRPAAADATEEVAAQEAVSQVAASEVVRISTMIGAPVQLQSGAAIGRVTDFVIADQRIENVVVSVEQRVLAVPFSLARLDIARRLAIVNVDRERFLQLPPFVRNAQVQTVTALLQASIQLQGGATFGRIADVIMTNRGFLEFAVLSFQERFVAVPFSLARLELTRQLVFIDVTRQRILQAPSLTANQFARAATLSEFTHRAHVFFNTGTPQTQPNVTVPPKTGPKDKVRPEPSKPHGKPEVKPPMKTGKPPEKLPPTKGKPPENLPPKKGKPPENLLPKRGKPPEGPSGALHAPRPEFMASAPLSLDLLVAAYARTRASRVLANAATPKA